MKPYVLLGILLLGFAAAPCRAQPSDPDLARLNAGPTRRRFIEMVNLSRLPAEEQKKNLARAMLLLHQMPRVGYARSGVLPYFSSPRSLPPDAGKHTPEELAAWILKGDEGERALGDAAREVGRKMLWEHRAGVAPLLRADLAGGEASARRALDMLRILSGHEPDAETKAWLRGFYDNVLAVFERDSPVAWDAARLMPLLGDPRAVGALVERDPARPTLFYSELSALSNLAPPHPRLVDALDSPDAKVRNQALIALPSSDDLLPRVARMLQDADSDVRWMAALNIFGMSDAAVARVRAELVPLLRDPDASMRRLAEREFAKRKDAVAAPALLARLREEAAKPGRSYDRAALHIKEMVGDAFDAVPLDDDPKSESFKKAVADFEKWIAEHPAK